VRTKFDIHVLMKKSAYCGYDAHTLFQTLTKKSLTCKERNTLQAWYPITENHGQSQPDNPSRGIFSLLKLRFISLKRKQPFRKRVVRTKFDIHVFISTNCGYPAVFLIPEMGCQVETAHGFQ
jgi:hypothetical protein